MMDRTPQSAAAPGNPALPAERERIVAALQDHSLEVSVRAGGDLERSLAAVRPGSDVYISVLASTSPADVLAIAARLRKAGFNPVPHIAARLIRGHAQLDDFLARASGEAGVQQALLIAGDIAQPLGPFDATLQILETGLFEKHGFRRLGIGGHPEGSPKIAAAVLDEVLVAKDAFAQRSDIEFTIVTQFCFDAAPILAWVARTRALGIRLPITIGLAGPASIKTLLKFAITCGVGASVKALGSHSTMITRLLSENGPEPIIRATARAIAVGDPAGIAGFHFFPFGGVERTARWALAIAEGRFTLNPNGSDFSVTK
ncbi:MAG: methylenetetrahydrofolate reductase [Rhodospirillales bacterium]|jgi:methylenetetrahydrofolate reductase (NADPH)|nr:methylenetetrahydrofolate reductase [Rhodospirillales bacterium]